ncbi:60S ribosomal protein L24 [Hibiscus syriacus]|uniref:60S ribosomal protein L24 n=1 Tax=Hibiscus syriacus TaxID=106335 RepID=A0A6A2ZEE4_HIBSY|nr:60S ribosomal protein L24 [Hibiscus syriacus]
MILGRFHEPLIYIAYAARVSRDSTVEITSSAAAAMVSRRSFAGSVVPRYTQGKAPDSFVLILRSSSFPIRNARGHCPRGCEEEETHTKKPYSRSIVGATLEVIQKKRSEKPEVRDAAREAALREIKERIKKTKDEKKAKKAEVAAKQQKTQGKSNIPKGGAPKGPKLGGGGGKR